MGRFPIRNKLLKPELQILRNVWNNLLIEENLIYLSLFLSSAVRMNVILVENFYFLKKK